MHDKLEIKEALESLGFRKVSPYYANFEEFETERDNYRYFCTILCAQTLRVSVQLYSYSREEEAWNDELFREMYRFINQVNSDSFLMKLSEQAGVLKADYILDLSPCEDIRSQIASFFPWFVSFKILHLKEKILERPIFRNGMGRRAHWGIRPPLKRLRYSSEWTADWQYSEGLVAVVDRNGSYGYLDADLKEVIPCRWAFAHPFSEELAAVKDHNGRYGFIDRTGRVVIPCEWAGAKRFSQGLAAVMNAHDEWGFINADGQLIIRCAWTETYDFAGGRAIVWDEDFAPYIIDAQGYIVAYGQEALKLGAAIGL